MAPILKPNFVHASIGNAPYIISAAATAALPGARTFTGTGAPSNSTLPAGNGKYNAATSGCAVNATLNAAGANYAVGDVLTISGGTGTALQLTVDLVNGGGAIQDFHVSRAGNYTAYPPVSASSTGGSGSGATFYLNAPPPDFYLDVTAPDTPVLYICTASGSNATSTWTKMGGGGTQQFKVVSDQGDFWYCNTWDGTTQGTTNVAVAKPYRLRAGTGAITSEMVNRGSAITYTYTYGQLFQSGICVEYQRAVTGNDGSSETDYVTPPVLPGNIIVAVPFSTTSPTSLAGVNWIYNGPEAWAN